VKRLAAFVLMMGCSSDPITEIVLTVDQVGINVGRDIDTVHIDIGSDKSKPENFLSVGIALCAALPSGGCHDLPLTATLVPGHDMPSDSVRLEVQGKLGGDGAGVVRIRDVANFRFTRGESLRLEIVLTPNCLDDPLHCADVELACAQQGCYAPMPEPAGADLAVQLDLSAPRDLSGVDFKNVDFACRPDCPVGYCGADKAGCGVACTCDSQAFQTCGSGPNAMMCVPCGLDNQSCCPKAPQCQSMGFACDAPDETGTCVRCAALGNSCASQPCCTGGVCGAGGLCVSCGHANEPCCLATPSCGTNLTCINNSCAPCGTLGIVCCRNGVDPTCETETLCHSGVPPGGGPGSEYCKHCGDPGEACCQGGTPCNTFGYACNMTNTCAPCGSVAGAGCCAGTCSGLLDCNGGYCSPCGQNAGDACCSNGSCASALLCFEGTHCDFPDMAMPSSPPCGDKDEPCCPPSAPPCNSNWLVCNGTCQCGNSGQPCCQDLFPSYCTVGNVCTTIPSAPPVCQPGGATTGTSGGSSGGICPSNGTCGQNCCYNGLAGTCDSVGGWTCCTNPAGCTGTVCNAAMGQCYQ
jgi:hypothetical protein